MGFHFRDTIPYPTRAEGRGNRGIAARANRRAALARALNRDGMTKAEYQRATQGIGIAMRAERRRRGA